MKRRWPIILFVGVLAASLVFTAYLVREVREDLRILSTADNDDVSWNLAQLEVETLNLQLAADRAVQNPQDDLVGFVRRFDIFYSRVDILTKRTPRALFETDPKVTQAFDAFSAFLTDVTPVVDGPRDALREAMPQITALLADLRPQARAIALAGIQKFAALESQRRADFSLTLIKLAVSVLGLLALLTIALLTLKKLFREGQRMMQDNETVRSRFEAAISSSLDAVLVVDTFGKVLEFNGAAATVFGYTPEEALGKDMARLIIPDHMRDMHTKGMTRFLRTGEKKVIDAGRVRLEAKRKSGEIFPVELSISLAETDGERVFVSYLRDITADIKAEEDLRAARDKAREGEKAKSDLLTVMSHEMRTPLNGILGSLSLIDQSGMEDRQKQHLRSIAASGELLLSHVNDVLDLSSLSSDARPKEKIRFDLEDVLQSVTDSLMANAETRGNTLTYDILSPNLRVVFGYKTALQQCLINLVGNAIKFTSDGAISVEVERLSDDDLIEIRVSDTGVGIAPENLDRVFEEFVTIDTGYDRENAGTGLGLAITKRLVESMDGRIEADSFLGEGSLFTLTLPLPDASHVEKPRHHVPAETNAHFAGTRALVVDDNEINRMVLTDMLTGVGVEVEEAADGYSAVDLVAVRAFDVIFLDISMPGIDGMETLHRIRALDGPGRDTPAIAVTAHAAKKDHENILQAPFLDLVVKPVDSTTLQAQLAQAVPQKMLSDEPVEGPSDEPDFKRRFGAEKYQKAQDALLADLEALAALLKADSTPPAEIKDLAHKSAGTAAILEEQHLWSLLSALEEVDADTWPDAQSAFLSHLSERIPA